MDPKNRLGRAVETVPSERTVPFGTREDALVVAASTAISAGVLYDVYRRQTRDQWR